MKYIKTLALIASLSFSILFLSFKSQAEETGLFQSVYAEKRMDMSDVKSKTNSTELPLFIIEDEKLYLKVQSTRNKWNLYTEVSYPIWTSLEINKLQIDNPEIIKLFPSPSAKNCGIEWITE